MNQGRIRSKILLLLSIFICASAFNISIAYALNTCTVGQRVIKPSGTLATVTAVQGSGCTIRADGENFTDVYAAFMLEAAPVAASSPKSSSQITAPNNSVANAANHRPNNGFYQCVSGAAGNLTLNILSASRYSNAQGVTGNYSIDNGGKIAFNTGPWAGYYGRVLAGGRIGLTSSASSNFYQMTCDRRR